MKNIILIGLLGAVLTGCISYRTDGDHNRQEVNSVRAGVTTADWLQDNLGAPKSVRKTGKGSEIWHYQFSEKEKTHVSLFLIFSVSNENEQSSDYYFEIADGVVESFWQD